MKRQWMWLAATLMVLTFPAAVRADLCPTCRGKMYIMSIGKCVECGGHTTSGAHKLCRKCSRKLQQCEHCRAALGPKGAVAPKAPAGAIDYKNGGTWSKDGWQYTIVVRAKGTRSEGRIGSLRYKGKPLPDAGINDYYQTPWGKIYWVGKGRFRWGDHAWMPRPKRGAPQGKQRKLGGAPAPTGPPAPLELTDADNGKTVRLAMRQQILLKLKGNPTTGYAWVLANLQGDAVQLVGKPKYQSRPHRPGMVGVGGAFTFTFRSVRPGRAAIKLVYARPWEKGKDPARTFLLTVRVEAAKKPAKAADRAKRLLAEPGNFAFHLHYFGESDKPFYSLLVVGARPKAGPKPKRRDFDLKVHATKRQVEQLVTWLAESGYLKQARDAMTDAIDPATGPCYLLRVTGGSKTAPMDLRGSLGWGSAMENRLKSLRQATFGPTTEALDKLLARLPK